MKTTAMIGLVAALLVMGSYYFGVELVHRAVLAAFDSGNDKKNASDDRQRAIAVDAASVQTGVGETIFATTGEVIADNRVELTSEVNGKVEEILVTDGTRVEAGNPILRFDPESERALLQASDVSVDDARRSYERVDQLAEDEFATPASLGEAAAALESAIADREVARTRLEERTVRTPFTGEIGLVAISPGAVLEPGSVIAELATTDDLRVRFSLPERFAAEVEVGTPIRLQRNAGDAVETEIAILSPLADRATRSVEGEAIVPDLSGYRPGSFANVAIVLDRRDDALFVPETAIVYEGLSTAIFRIENDQARRIAVETGSRRGGSIRSPPPAGPASRRSTSSSSCRAIWTPPRPTCATACRRCAATFRTTSTRR